MERPRKKRRKNLNKEKGSDKESWGTRREEVKKGEESG